MAKLISIFLQLSLQAVSEGSFSGWFYRLSLKTFSAICLCRLSLKAVSAGCLYRLFVQVVSAGFFSGYPCKLPLKALRAIVSSDCLCLWLFLELSLQAVFADSLIDIPVGCLRRFFLSKVLILYFHRRILQLIELKKFKM